MLGHREFTMEDYLGIARRRKWLLILPPVLLCATAFLISLLIPNRYSSMTQVLVQAQSVPTSIVQPIINGQLNDRLASMKEQILSRSRLQPIVEQFNLFDNSNLLMDARVQKLHEAITVDPIEPMQDTRSSQLPGFRITVTLGTARLAQQVCSEVTTLFVEEDKRSRHATAGGITSFIGQNLQDAQNKMNEQDAKLAAFKGRYMGSLPEDGPASLQMIGSLSTQLEAVTRGLDSDQQSKTFNESMLQQEISTWKASLNGTAEVGPDALAEQLKKAQDDLVKLRAQYTDEWPDVKNKVAEIEQIKQKIAAAQANKSAVPNPADKQIDVASTTPTTESAAIAQRRALLNVIEISIKDKTRQQDELRTKIRTYEARLQLSPAVEQQYKELTRDFATAQEEYSTLLKEQGVAVRGTELDQTQEGEQFHILDAASLPEKPNFPPRLAIAGGGFAAGLALGLGVIMFLETRDKSLRTESDVAMFLKIPTLAMVPEIDKRSAERKRFVFAAGKGDGSLEAKA
jgi:polysaccharide chain length determinant protein (PEP-CTERM system associated)